VSTWALGDSGLSENLAELQSLLVDRCGPPGASVALGDGWSARDGSLLLCGHDEESAGSILGWLNKASVERSGNIIVIVGDGYLGTDIADQTTATIGGAVVAAVRSLAAKRGSKLRANVVCVPQSLIGGTSEQRGPLKLEPESSDVVEAVLFLLDEQNSYVNGQVLFVNGGRQLFSSHTS
jgi:hypothetical protein